MIFISFRLSTLELPVFYLHAQWIQSYSFSETIKSWRCHHTWYLNGKKTNTHTHTPKHTLTHTHTPTPPYQPHTYTHKTYFKMNLWISEFEFSWEMLDKTCLKNVLDNTQKRKLKNLLS